MDRISHSMNKMTQTKHVLLTKEQFETRKRARLQLSAHPQFWYHESSTAYPPEANLLALAAEPYDQGQSGSCTANAICGAIRLVEKDKSFQPSRLFVYYEERIREHQTNSTLQDSGANPWDGLTSLKVNGVCEEKDWPFDISKLEVAPTAECYQDALKHRSYTVGHVASSFTFSSTLLDDIRKSIHNKIPILIGITVYSSFESEQVAKTGIVPMPDTSTETLEGYHEVLIIGYDDAKKQVLVRNSWGAGWGDHGNFYLPYEFITTPSLCSQFLCVSCA